MGFSFFIIFTTTTFITDRFTITTLLYSVFQTFSRKRFPLTVKTIYKKNTKPQLRTLVSATCTMVGVFETIEGTRHSVNASTN